MYEIKEKGCFSRKK